jgi:hypothetical protein
MNSFLDKKDPARCFVSPGDTMRVRASSNDWKRLHNLGPLLKYVPRNLLKTAHYAHLLFALSFSFFPSTLSFYIVRRMPCLEQKGTDIIQVETAPEANRDMAE